MKIKPRFEINQNISTHSITSVLKCTITIPIFVFLILHSNTTGLVQEFSWPINVGLLVIFLNNLLKPPGRVAQLVRASSRFTKVADSIPSQGSLSNQAVNARMSRTTNRCPSLPLPLPLSLSQINKWNKKFLIIYSSLRSVWDKLSFSCPE